jgi:large subunit ribosomal protein L14e
VKRHVINVKWVALTDYAVPCARNARQASLTKAWTSEDVLSKWKASAWGKKVAARATKAGQNDFQRFQARLKKQAINKAVRAKVAA